VRTSSPRVAALIDEAADLIRSGEDAEAVLTLLESALPEADDDPALWYHLGYVRLQAGLTEEGAAALERSLALEEEPNGYLYLGYARIELGAFEAAREALTRCLALGGPEQARYELAYACLHEGRHEDAAKHGRQYVANVPDDPDGWELYDAVCQKLGRARSFKRLLTQFGDDALVELLEGRDAFSMGEPPFPVPFAGGAEEPGSGLDVKLDFLAAVGGAYLGTSSDDGVACRGFRRRGLSARDCAAMLVRLEGVVSAARVRLSAVHGADDASAPVAAAAAELFGVPLIAADGLRAAGRGEVPGAGRILWLQAIGHDWLTFRRRTAPYAGRLLTVVLAVDWFQAGLPFTPRFTPDVTGFIALGVTDDDDPPTPAQVRDRIREALRTLPPDEGAQQRHFYRSQPGLRFR
jgi:tetratricopeptide (TPR) repeat protein